MTLEMEGSESAKEKPYKIAIVGPSEEKWTEEQKIKARQYIRNLLGYCMDGLVPLKVEIYTLVSGHCPKGGVDIWAEEIADTLGIQKEIYSAEVEQWNDKYVVYPQTAFESMYGYEREKLAKGYRSRNIQIAEACDVLYCIVPRTHLPKGFDITNPDSFTMKQARTIRCIHCQQLGHPTNGGCWTKKYAEGIGRPTHLVVIE